MSRVKLIIICVLSWLALCWIIPAQLFQALAGSKRAWRVWLEIDDALSVSTGGTQDISMSARAGLARRQNKLWGKIFAGILDFLDPPDHCDRAMKKEIEEAEEVKKMMNFEF